MMLFLEVDTVVVVVVVFVVVVVVLVVVIVIVIVVDFYCSRCLSIYLCHRFTHE